MLEHRLVGIMACVSFHYRIIGRRTATEIISSFKFAPYEQNLRILKISPGTKSRNVTMVQSCFPLFLYFLLQLLAINTGFNFSVD